MEIASLIKKLLLIGVVGVLLIIFLFWWTLYRKQSTNINDIAPFSDIVGQDLIAEQEAFIALNYEAFVEENPYILQMHDRFYEDAGKPYQLPKGTVFTIEAAKSYYHPVSGFWHSYVLGSVFIEELGQVVKFEFPWGSQEIEDLSGGSPNYRLYELAPWQKIRLPFKFFEGGTKEPYVWEALIKDYDFNMTSNRFVKRDSFQTNRNFDNYYSKQEDWAPEKPYFGEHNELSIEEIDHLNLTQIYPDYSKNKAQYTFHPDYRILLSKNTISLVVTVFMGAHEMESMLINYDLNGEIVEHLKISSDEIAEGILQSTFLHKGDTLRLQETNAMDSHPTIITDYIIQDNGHIQLIN